MEVLGWTWWRDSSSGHQEIHSRRALRWCCARIFTFQGILQCTDVPRVFSSKGTAVISNPTQCLELMKKWEEAMRQHCFAAACVWWNLSPSAPAHAFYRCSPVCSFSQDLISARSSFSFSGRQPDVVISTALSLTLVQGLVERLCGIDETFLFLSGWWRPGEAICLDILA